VWSQSWLGFSVFRGLEAVGVDDRLDESLRGLLGQVVPDAREHPDGDALPGQVRGEAVAGLAGAEDDAGRSSLMSGSSPTTSSRAVGNGGTSMPAVHAMLGR
jgi:hypothetical protein